jgi:cardiolipin synthase A/B
MPSNQPNRNLPGQKFKVDGHDLFLVHSPQERLDAILAVIGTAHSSIRMISYMFRDDQTGKEVLAALIQAAERGVNVYLIIDSFGSAETKDSFFAPLVYAGGRYHYFSGHWNLGYIIRNHQKILIADETHVLVGGFNVTDYYVGRAGDESWEDFGAILSGPKTAVMVAYFDCIAELSDDGGIRFGKLRRLILDWKTGESQVQWLLGGPSNRMSPWARTLKADLEKAQSLSLVSAYFSPSTSIYRRIAKVTRKGQSQMILAGKSDNKATINAARSLYSYFLKRGARIFEFAAQPLHMKLLVIDDAAYIGSANLDARSLFINLEIMLRIEDKVVATHIRGVIDAMKAQSVEQTPALHAARSSLFARIKWGLSYLLVSSVDYTIGRRIKFGLLRRKG